MEHILNLPLKLLQSEAGHSKSVFALPTGFLDHGVLWPGVRVHSSDVVAASGLLSIVF